jgi:hypothetical protein
VVRRAVGRKRLGKKPGWQAAEKGWCKPENIHRLKPVPPLWIGGSGFSLLKRFSAAC